MIFDIFANIFDDGDGEFRVIVSAFPTDVEAPVLGQPHRSEIASTEEEAERTRDALVAEITEAVRQHGGEVRRVALG